MKQVLQLRQGTAPGGLTIKELNDLLDQLASSENRFTVFALLFLSICYLCAMFVVRPLL
jgi:DNA ligase-4